MSQTVEWGWTISDWGQIAGREEHCQQVWADIFRVYILLQVTFFQKVSAQAIQMFLQWDQGELGHFANIFTLFWTLFWTVVASGGFETESWDLPVGQGVPYDVFESIQFGCTRIHRKLTDISKCSGQPIRTCFKIVWPFNLHCPCFLLSENLWQFWRSYIE